MEELLGVYDLETYHITQIIQLSGHVILSYEIYQVISLGIVPGNIFMRRNRTRNVEKMMDQLLVHAQCVIQAICRAIEGNLKMSNNW